ncbi:hypothetical protein JCM14036_04430 [Desulfotomaculum defluvii]
MISTGKGKVTELRLHRDINEQGLKVRRGKKGGRLILFLSVAIVGYMAFSLFNQFTRVDNMQSSVKTLQSQVEELKTRNEALRAEIKQIKSESYIEQAAREQLGLVKPGETLVVPAQTEQENTPSESGKPAQQNNSNGEAFNVKYKNIYD